MRPRLFQTGLPPYKEFLSPGVLSRSPVVLAIQFRTVECLRNSFLPCGPAFLIRSVLRGGWNQVRGNAPATCEHQRTSPRPDKLFLTQVPPCCPADILRHTPPTAEPQYRISSPAASPLRLDTCRPNLPYFSLEVDSRIAEPCGPASPPLPRRSRI